jgi:hypothetical protein
MGTFNTAKMQDLRNLNSDGPIAEEVGAVPFPVMLLAGEKDAVLSPGTVRRAGELLPTARVEIVPGAPHSMYWETPDLFNDALRKFLAEVYANAVQVGASAIWMRPCDDDFGDGVAGDLRSAPDDDVSAFPGALSGVEGYLLGHPLVIVERRPIDGPVGQVGRGTISRPGRRAPSGLPLVGLHPDKSVDQVRYLPAPGAVPFNDQQRAAGRDLDRSFPAVLIPVRGPVTDRPTVVHGYQDPVNQQVRPAKAGMLPGDVVRVDDNGSGDQLADPGGQRGFAVVAAPVHGQHGRPGRTTPVWSPPGRRVDDRAQQRHAPRSGFGLFWG